MIIIQKNVSAFARTLVVLALLLSLVGCYVKNPSYPNDWPALMQPNEIEKEIEGSFACEGSTTFSATDYGRKGAYLPFLLATEKQKVPVGGQAYWCSRIEIERVTNGFEIRYMNFSRLSKTEKYLKDIDYKIDKGWIIFNSVDRPTAEIKDSTQSQITINNENDLVTKAKSFLVGMVLVPIPVGSSITNWGKFERIPDMNESDQLEFDAERGNTDSQLALFKKISGENPEEALVWLCKSADAGNLEARITLGNIFENSGYIWIKEGVVERNYKLAYVWYTLSGQYDQEDMKHFAERWQLDPEKTLEEWQPGNCENELGLPKNN